MKAVNDSARGTIIKLIEKGPYQPEKRDRYAFATWVAMFCMTYEFADLRTMVTTPQERFSLMQTKQAPSYWTIMIGSYRGDRWAEQTNHRAFGPKGASQATGQCNVFTLGRTVVVTLSGLGLGNDFARQFADKHGLAEVWPSLGATFGLRDLNDPEIDEIAGVFEAFQRSPA